jgi:hypothetical protein
MDFYGLGEKLAFGGLFYYLHARAYPGFCRLHFVLQVTRRSCICHSRGRHRGLAGRRE